MLSVTAAPIGPPMITQEMVMGGGRFSAGSSRRQYAQRSAPFPPPATSAPPLAITAAPPVSFARDPRTATSGGSGWHGGSTSCAVQLPLKSEQLELPLPQPSTRPCTIPCTALVTRPPEAFPKMIECLSNEWCVFAREFGFTYHEVAPAPARPPPPLAPAPFLLPVSLAPLASALLASTALAPIPNPNPNPTPNPTPNLIPNQAVCLMSTAVDKQAKQA